MSFLLALILAGSPTCERKPGKAQCVEVERRTESLYRCKASCYRAGRPDGGVYPVLIKAEKDSAEACVAELDRQAANGCQP